MAGINGSEYDLLHTCEQCGKYTNHQTGNRYLCKDCQISQNNPENDTFKKYACVSCGTPTNQFINSQPLCHNCAEINNTREDKTQKKSTGGKYICINCGAETAGNEFGEPICEDCEQQKENQVICPECFNEVEILINGMCEKCLQKNKEKDQENTTPLNVYTAVCEKCAETFELPENNPEETVCPKCLQEEQTKDQNNNNKSEAEEGNAHTDTNNQNQKIKNSNNSQPNTKQKKPEEKGKNQPLSNAPTKGKKDESFPGRGKNVQSPATSPQNKLQNKLKEQFLPKNAKNNQLNQKVAAAKKKAEQIKKMAKNIKKTAGFIKKIITFFSTPPGHFILIVLGVVVVLAIIAALMSGIMSGIVERGITDDNTGKQWDQEGFTKDYQDSDGNQQNALYKGWDFVDAWTMSQGLGMDGINYLEKMPARTTDLRNTPQGFIANAVMPRNAAVPSNNKKDYIICQPGIEMHLATKGNQYNPWAAGAHLELPGIGKGRDAENYMTGLTDYSASKYPNISPSTSPATKQQWIDAGSPTDAQFHGGARTLTPEEEQFYVNMRWPYDSQGYYFPDSSVKVVGKSSDYYGKKVVIVNPKTGRMAIGIVGEWGPNKKLGEPAGNRMTGMSPDLMWYLTDGNPGDNMTEVEVAFAVDQSVPLGPFLIGSGSVNFRLGVLPQQKALALKLLSSYEQYPGGLSIQRKMALKRAFSLLSCDYLLGGSGPNQWDCSSFVQEAWSAGGLQLVRPAATMGEKADQILGPATKSTILSKGKPGDIMYHSIGGDGYTGHIIIFAGIIDGIPYYVHAGGDSNMYDHLGNPATGAVVIAPMSNYYYNKMTLVRYNKMN